MIQSNLCHSQATHRCQSQRKVLPFLERKGHLCSLIQVSCGTRLQLCDQALAEPWQGQGFCPQDHKRSPGSGFQGIQAINNINKTTIMTLATNEFGKELCGQSQ